MARPRKNTALLRATPESYVVQANSLARGKLDANPSVHGMRLLAVAMSKVDGNADLLNQITISPSELRELFPSYRRSKDLGRHLSDAADQLLGLRGEVYHGPEKWAKINLVKMAVYDGTRDGLRIEFQPEMSEFLLRLKGSFTRYQLRSIAQLVTSTQLILYQFFRSYLHEGGVDVSLDDIRSRIGLRRDEYSETRDLMRRVINPAVENINDRTDIRVTYTPIKTGRAYIGLRFKLSVPNGAVTSTEAQALINLLIAQGVEADAARNLATSTPWRRALMMMAYATYQSSKGAKSGRGPVTNMGGYLVKVFAQNVEPPIDDAEFKKHARRMEDEFRAERYSLLPPADQDAMNRMFVDALPERLRFEYNRFGGAETAELKGAFTAFLRTMILPENTQMALVMGARRL